MDGRPTWTDCDEAGDYVVPNVLSPRDLVSRPDIMDETVPHTFKNTCLFSGERSLPFGLLVTLVQKVKIGHTKRFSSKDKSRLCRDFAGYFISK